MADMYSMLQDQFPAYTGPTASGVTAVGGQVAAAPTTSMFSNMSLYAGPMMGLIGAIGQGFGTYFASRAQKSQLEFQSHMADINARMAENTAQSILQAGGREASNLSLRAGKVLGSQKASFGARGIQGGVGSAAEEIATTNLMKETDMLTINANAVRQASAERMRSTNYKNQSLLSGTSADSISPFGAGASSFLSGASQVAPSWYNLAKAKGWV